MSEQSSGDESSIPTFEEMGGLLGINPAVRSLANVTLDIINKPNTKPEETITAIRTLTQLLLDQIRADDEPSPSEHPQIFMGVDGALQGVALNIQGHMDRNPDQPQIAVADVQRYLQALLDEIATEEAPPTE